MNNIKFTFSLQNTFLSLDSFRNGKKKSKQWCIHKFLLELSCTSIFVDLFHDYKHTKIFWSLTDQSGSKRSFTGLLRMPAVRKF